MRGGPTADVMKTHIIINVSQLQNNENDDFGYSVHEDGDGGFFILARILGGRFYESFPAYAFFFWISARAHHFHLFRPV